MSDENWDDSNDFNGQCTVSNTQPVAYGRNEQGNSNNTHSYGYGTSANSQPVAYGRNEQGNSNSTHSYGYGTSANSGGQNVLSAGRSFGKGRGFTAKIASGNNDNNGNGFANKSYGSSDTYGSRNGRRDDDDDDDEPGRDRDTRKFNRRFENKTADNSDYNNESATDGNPEEPERTPVTYIPPDIQQLSIDDIITGGNAFADYDKIDVRCSGNDVPNPLNSFRDAGFHDEFYRSISEIYKKPTPIQKYAIPCIINGRDIMACSQTGSGKTAAFMFPIIDNLITSGGKEAKCDRRSTEPHVLILAPTRELVIQIAQASCTFARQMDIKIEVLYGGTSVRSQRDKITGAHVLVATVGRLVDFMNKGYVNFSSLKYLVLDEADRMLDMGFKTEIEKIVIHETMPEHRQTLMFSATFSDDVQRLAANYLKDYVFIAAGVVGGACKDVEQVFYEVSRSDKRSKVCDLLKNEHSPTGTLVFVETKKNADYLSSYLSRQDIRTTSIHGDRLQEQREEALHKFRTGEMCVLVATSVAARGLDIKGVKHVINYDLPKDIDDYVHRIGRTGRVGNYGKATSFYDPGENSNLAGDLVRILREAKQEVPSFLQSKPSSFGSGYDDSFGGHDYRGENFASSNSQRSNALPPTGQGNSSMPVLCDEEEVW